ncbi:MAG: ATP-binding protein [Desulfobaccales bacterium]
MDIKRIFTHWPFRSKLLLFLLIIFLPALGIIVATGLSQRQHALVKAQDDALLLVRSLVAQQEQIAIATKAMLSTLAQLPEVQNLEAPACNRIFAELHRLYPFYASILAMTPDGYVFAAHRPLEPGTVNQSDRKYFRDAISSLDFSAGEYIIGRVSQTTSFNYSVPVLNANKKLVAVLTAGLNLHKVGQFISFANLPEGSAVVFVDHKGVRLYRSPENEATPIGKPVSQAFFGLLSGQAEPRLFELTGIDGINRIIAFKQVRLREGLPPYLYIIVGLPKDPILHKANLNMMGNLSILGIAALLALSLAWVIGNLVIIKPINRLVAATQRFGMGKMDTRTGLPHSPDELGQLARSFDDMASLLEARNIERQREEEALNKAYAELEERVQERTAELTASNSALMVEIAERKQAEEALQQSEETYRSLVQTIPAVVFKGYVDWSVDFFDEKIEEITGYKKEEFDSRRMKWSDVILPEDFQNAKNVFRQALKTKKSYIREYRITDKEGNHLWVQERGRLICNKDNNIEYINGVLFNITEMKKIEEDRLMFSKIESLGLLAGGIAHDFNNILTVILGNIGLALLYSKIEPKAQDRLAQAEQACQRAQALSRQLLTFAKGGTPIKKIVSIANLVKESAILALSGSKSRLEVSITNDLWSVEADEAQINQVISNLLINADQAMPKGGVIKIKAENSLVEAESNLPVSKGKYVKFAIADQGIGISPKYLDQIFAPYFSTKQKGSGLGLATAYSIIKNHSGHIQVESQMGVGTTFYIYLPATDKRVSADEPETGKPTMGQGKVLVMDDEEMVREVLGGMLSRLGYEADFASDGSQAIEKFVQAKEANQAFDTVILDLTIPGGMGGKEAIQGLLKIDPQVKAIVSSGYSDDPIMADFRKYGVSEVIAKPYRVSELSKILQRVIPEKRAN